MAGIPSTIHTKLESVLSRCGPFGSERELQAVFADERLAPWRNSVPTAYSSAGRVSQTIALLSDGQNNSGENALVLFLDVLQERADPDDSCHNELGELARELRATIGEPPKPHLTIRQIEGLPDRLTVGQSLTLTLQVVNDGKMDWSLGERFEVAILWRQGNDSGRAPQTPWLFAMPQRVRVGEEAEIGPTTLTVPPETGDFQLQLRVSGRGDSWRGLPPAEITRPVMVIPAFNITLLNVQPNPLPAGNFQATVQIRNDGTEPWAQGQKVRVWVTHNNNEPLGLEWTRPLADEVRPGTIVNLDSFSGRITPGIVEEQLAWWARIADWPDSLPSAGPYLVEVSKLLPVYQLAIESVWPNPLPAGEFQATIKVRNNGSETWHPKENLEITAQQQLGSGQTSVNRQQWPYTLNQEVPAGQTLTIPDRIGTAQYASLETLATDQPQMVWRVRGLDWSAESEPFSTPIIARPVEPPPPPRPETKSVQPTVIIQQISNGQSVRQAEPTIDTIMISVGKNEVELRYDIGGQRTAAPYISPNLIKQQELLQAENPKQQGQLLFKGIINNQAIGGEGSDLSTESGYQIARSKLNGNYRVELFIQPGDLELHGHKWEYLSEATGRPLAVNQNAPFYRRLQTMQTDQNLLTITKLNILVAICNPINLGKGYLAGLIRLDGAKERAVIDQGLKKLVENGAAACTILDGENGRPPTWDNIREELQNGQYDVLHLLGHGLFDQGQYRLIMEDEQRADYPATTDDLGRLLTGKNLRLVVLAACDSAISASGDALRGLGPELVRKGGVPAVVAMQDKVSIGAAQFFASYFYGELARTGRVDTAVAATRHALYDSNERQLITEYDWGIPVLFLGDADGRLFHITQDKVGSIEPPRLKSHQELPGRGDPTLPKLAQTIAAEAQSYGFSPQSIATMQAALAPTVANFSAPAGTTKPLAKPQDRQALSQQMPKIVKMQAKALEQEIKKTGLQLPETAYQQISIALNTGKHIILTGPPGTGKTTLAEAICRYAKEQKFTPDYVLTTATADWTTFDTVGGYVPTSQQNLQFQPGTFLQAISQGHWLVIDEINRAEIDKAFGELFTVLSGQSVELPYQVDNHQLRVLPFAREHTPEIWWDKAKIEGEFDYVVHPNWRVIGTMNEYDRSYLYKMSLAFMRRFAFIELDLPEYQLYLDLCDSWLGKELPLSPNDPLVEPIRDFLKKLLGNDEQLNTLIQRRPLGPAIIRDIIRYVADYYTQQAETLQRPLQIGDLLPHTALADAFLLYVLPQLDGLDQDGIFAIYRQMATLFDKAEAIKREQIYKRIQSFYLHIPPADWPSL